MARKRRKYRFRPTTIKKPKNWRDFAEHNEDRPVRPKNLLPAPPGIRKEVPWWVRDPKAPPGERRPSVSGNPNAGAPGNRKADVIGARRAFEKVFERKLDKKARRHGVHADELTDEQRERAKENAQRKIERRDVKKARRRKARRAKRALADY